MNFDPSSRARLNSHDLPRFQGPTLFDHVARVVCEASCLPRKELYEAWEVAKRTRRWFLFLVALYESWMIPIAVLLSVGTGLFGAMLALKLTGLENNV